MWNKHKGRNPDNVRRINRAAQRKYSAKERSKRAPRADDVSRAVMNVIRNERDDIMKLPGGRKVLFALLDKARAALLDKGYDPAQVQRKFVHVLKPRTLTIAEAEALAQRHYEEEKASPRSVPMISKLADLKGLYDGSNDELEG